MHMHHLILNTQKVSNFSNFSKFYFPSRTLKMNIVLNVKNKEIKDLRTSLLGEARILLIFGIVSLA